MAFLTKKSNLITVSQDNMSAVFEDFVPKQYHDTDQFLNIVQWNIEWFGARKNTERDKKRKKLVTDILAMFNADLFVFQEIAGPSADGRYEGVLDEIADELTERGMGDYVVYYTYAGGEQRVAMMWDREFIKAKEEVQDLFDRGTYQKPGKKDPFAGRTPLYGHFTSRIEAGEAFDKYDFQVVGLHLKAMADGVTQRAESAKILVDYLEKDFQQKTGDILMMGDFNAPPDDKKSWSAFHQLEKKSPEQFKFTAINDPSDFSYMWLKNMSDKYVSRIDLTAMSLSSELKVGSAGTPVKWKPIEEAISRAGKISDKEVRDTMSEIKELISDHLPVLTQFYIEDPAVPPTGTQVKSATKSGRSRRR